MSPSKSRGAIYFAMGGKFVREAEQSAATLKKHNQSLPIVLFTDGTSHSKAFDRIEKITPQYLPLKQKCAALALTPFAETLFIDTDTMVLGDVTAPFALLEQDDFLLAGMRWFDFTTIPPRLLNYEKPHATRPEWKVLNTGVMYYRMNERVRSFMDYWLRSVQRCDQDALNNLIGERVEEKYGVTFKLIPNTVYNCRNVFLPRLRKEGRSHLVLIRHEHGLFDPVWKRARNRVRKTLGNLYRRTRRFAQSHLPAKT